MSAFRHRKMQLAFAKTPHLVNAGFVQPIRFIDESYWKLHGVPARLAILATSIEEREPRPKLWANKTATARLFGCIPSHLLLDTR